MSGSGSASSAKFISLGRDCQAAYQIRRASKDETAYFYDWVWTPLASSALPEIDDAKILMPGNWEIADNGERVLDNGTGLLYKHEFPHKENLPELIEGRLVEGRLDESRRKVIYLRHKTLDAIRSANQCILIRNEPELIDKRKADEAAGFILQSYRKINPGVKVILVASSGIKEIFDRDYLVLNVDQNPGVWQGDDHSWDRIFRIAHEQFCAPATFISKLLSMGRRRV